ncbi:MAG: hypothetical protein K9N47_18615 [Prosthecobacter sp.]|uniref:hypothetical protein n=1 Tax=Prosthecobacter sp. TaxID=1965333 RepID=UPI0025DB6B06|nr:hypothetical protein [Prosthecobacter sp.]MCF7788142.1 hypothetical protein [Prosthecobacter sp.]
MTFRKLITGGSMAALLCLTCFSPVHAVAQAEAVPAPGNGRSEVALSALSESFRQVDQELKAARALLKTKLAADEQARTEEQVQSLGAKREALLKDLELVVTGVEPQSFTAPAGLEMDLQQETRELLLPIIQELKQLTASPREVEGLRRKLAELRQRHQLAETAQQKLEEQMKLSADPTLKPLLGELLVEWKKRQNDAETELAVAEFKLEELEVKRGGVMGALKDVAQGFFRQRGRNLLLACAISLLIFGGMRLLWQRLNKLPALRRKNRSFGVRIAVVGYHGLSLLLAVFAVLLVFYLAGDWVLMGLAVLFLIGIAWTGKQTLPAMYEQIKLLLNLGSVREGERVIYNGLPWEVRTVGIFSELRNPALHGGHIRLPLRELTALISRPDEDEVWFPCTADEWVCLSDGTHGKVVTQTPDWVQLVLLGGSRRTYPTQMFLQLCPENLMKSFRVRSVFGIDYRHQSISTTEVPQKLKTHMERELRTLIGADHLKNVSVELSEAGSSALNYTVLADFSGEVAQRYSFLSRAIQRLCVDACNQNGWNIPFDQLTVHRGEPTLP